MFGCNMLLMVSGATLLCRSALFSTLLRHSQAAEYHFRCQLGAHPWWTTARGPLTDPARRTEMHCPARICGSSSRGSCVNRLASNGCPRCPLLAQSGHLDRLNPCPLLGVKQTCRNVRYSPESRHRRTLLARPLCAKSRHSVPLFDHLVGTGKYCRRNDEAECFCSFKVDHQLVLAGRLDR